jgi:hypothetical protein
MYNYLWIIAFNFFDCKIVVQMTSFFTNNTSFDHLTLPPHCNQTLSTQLLLTTFVYFYFCTTVLALSNLIHGFLAFFPGFLWIHCFFGSSSLCLFELVLGFQLEFSPTTLKLGLHLDHWGGPPTRLSWRTTKFCCSWFLKAFPALL